MKIAGWICTILGALAFIGSVSAGHNPTGPTFLLALGMFLSYRANSHDNEKK